MTESSTTRICAGYDRWASVYDTDANPLTALELPLVQHAAGDVAGLRTLDLGCGTGRHTSWLASAGAQVTAIDFSHGMLEQARQKPGADHVRFIEHDLHLPLPFDDQRDQPFDLVICGLVLEHLRELRACFGEMCRVLRPAGRAIISAMHPAMFLRGSQARFTDPATGDVVQPGSIDHSMSDIIMAIMHAGLSIESVREHAPDATFAQHYPRAEKYINWPMLLTLTLRRP